MTLDNGRYITTKHFWKNGEHQRIRRRHATIVTPLTPGTRPKPITSEDPDLVGDNSYWVPASSETVVKDADIFGDHPIVTSLPLQCITMHDYDASEHSEARILSDEEHIVWLSVRFKQITAHELTKGILLVTATGQ